MEKFSNGKGVMEPWIETYTGKKFWFTNEDPDEVDIEDIAHALSHMCRYTGHCNRFYSVAEHSCHVGFLTSDLRGLLHDASEAYLADIASPVKMLLPEYKTLEARIMRKIAKKFNLPEGFESHDDVKRADWTMLKSEAASLLPSRGKDWYFPQDIKPMIFYHLGMEPYKAKDFFLRSFERLNNGNSCTSSVSAC